MSDGSYGAQLERLILDAWPARTRGVLNGWTVLADAGVTGRVNAVAPLAFDAGVDLDNAIDAAVAWQSARSIRPCFKIANGCCFPASLPDTLAHRGWRSLNETLVMTAPLVDAIAHLPSPTGLVLSADYGPAIDAIIRDTAASDAEYAERSAIAARTPQPRQFAMLTRGGATAAVGLTVVTGAWAAIFLMRTHPPHRRQGLAHDILAALAEWAKTAGATHAYLQVEAANAPAIALFRAAAFETAYSYSYWRPETKP